jgi:hypothetical protein
VDKNANKMVYSMVQKIIEDMKSSSGIAVPLVTVVSIIGFVAWATSLVLQEKHKVEIHVLALQADIASVKLQLNDIETKLDSSTDDRWRKRDMRFFCVGAEAINDGWECPGIE